jgi:hypothetical protein
MKVVFGLLLLAVSGAAACSSSEGTPIEQCVCGIVSAVGDVNWNTCKSDFNTAAVDYDNAVQYFTQVRSAHISKMCFPPSAPSAPSLY